MEGPPHTPSLVDDNDKYALWDAAYVLGSCSDADRREYEAHLRGCQSCRQSVDQLSGIPDLLGQLTLEDVAAIDDRSSKAPRLLSPSALTSQPATVSLGRRSTRFATWVPVAAAAAVMVSITLVGVQFHWGAPTSVPTHAAASAVTMTPVATTELTATVKLTGYGWGTEIYMDCAYPAEPGTASHDEDEPGKLAMVVVGRDGSQDRLATWTAVDGAHATPAGRTAMPMDQIAAVEIVFADTGNVLLRRAV